MSNPEQPARFQEIVPAIPQRPSQVVECKDSNTGESFFSPMRRAKLTGISILRYQNHDIVALTTNDQRAIVVAAERDSFIAVELHDYKNPARRANLAFRDDISHRRLNLALSAASGEDVTYLDPKTVSGEMLPVDPAADFARFAFEQEAEIEGVRPSWYTEDWVTVNLADGRSIVIRTDRMKLTGAMSLDQQGVDHLNMRGDVSSIALNQPEQYSPRTKFLPGEETK